jgi:hypothetical protein
MSKLDVQGWFLINIGFGPNPGPELVVALSVIDEFGNPVELDVRNDDRGQGQVAIFVILSCVSDAVIPLRIVTSYPTDQHGFYLLSVATGGEQPSAPVEDLHPATLGIVVTTDAGRGQALATNCTPARVIPQFG